MRIYCDLSRGLVRDSYPTDGSCQLPSEVNSRWAAFAAVKPITPKQDILSLPSHDPRDLLDHHFEAVTLGMCKGQQTIPRAELQCVLALLPQDPNVVIITDSNYVLFAKDLILNVQDIRTLHKHTNFDLLQQLHRFSQTSGLPHFRKVRAHQSLTGCTLDQRWDRIGNMVADEAAKMAAMNLATELTSALRQQATEEKHSRNLLKQQYFCRYEMALKRVKAETEGQIKTAEDMDALVTEVLQWDPQPMVQFAPPPEMAEIAKVARWGCKFSTLMMQWLATLQWPVQPDTHVPPVGISWVELIFNFLLTTQHTIPTKQTDADGGWRYVCNETHPQFDFKNFNLGQVSLSFSGSIRHLQHLTKHDLLPSLEPTHTRSIQILGGNVFKQGLKLRTRMLLQDQTLSLLQIYLAEHMHGGKACFDVIPDIPVQDAIIFNDLESLAGDNHKVIDRRVREWLKQQRGAHAD